MRLDISEIKPAEHAKVLALCRADDAGAAPRQLAPRSEVELADLLARNRSLSLAARDDQGDLVGVMLTLCHAGHVTQRLITRAADQADTLEVAMKLAHKATLKLNARGCRIARLWTSPGFPLTDFWIGCQWRRDLAAGAARAVGAIEASPASTLDGAVATEQAADLAGRAVATTGVAG